MKRIVLAGIAGILLSSSAESAGPPAAMTAGEFLARAEPLMKRSKAVLIFSGEARTLMRMVGTAAQNNRIRLDAARAAGRPLGTCLPPKGKASVTSTELLAYLRALSPAQRRQSFDSAFAAFMQRKYPCR